MDANQLNIFVAFGVGFLSFASPCCLPLVPVYLGYMTGTTAQRGTGLIAAARWRLLLHSLAFVAGFSLIFILIGVAVGDLRDWVFEYKTQVEAVIGILLILFGLHTLGIFRISLFNIQRPVEFHPSKRLGYLRSLMIGVGFALGWTPCSSWALGLMSGMAFQGQTAAVLPLFIAYSLGLGVPFVVSALLAGQITVLMRKIMMKTFSLRVAGRTVLADLNAISLVSGALMLAMGVLMALNKVTWLNQFLPTWTIGA